MNIVLIAMMVLAQLHTMYGSAGQPATVGSSASASGSGSVASASASSSAYVTQEGATVIQPIDGDREKVDFPLMGKCFQISFSPKGAMLHGEIKAAFPYIGSIKIREN